jgi:vacuolar-type H+-ATPase subunit E/Vma4
MPRQKLHRDSIELDKEIARIQRESQAEIERLQKARAEAEAAEDRRRGELLRQYVASPRADNLRGVLDAISGPKDRAIRLLSTPH